MSYRDPKTETRELPKKPSRPADIDAEIDAEEDEFKLPGEKLHDWGELLTRGEDDEDEEEDEDIDDNLF
jgi:hypothetical protein